MLQNTDEDVQSDGPTLEDEVLWGSGGPSGESPLLMACRSGSLENIKLYSGSIDFASEQSRRYAYYVLGLACVSGSVESTRWLLERIGSVPIEVVSDLVETYELLPEIQDLLWAWLPLPPLPDEAVAV